MKNKTIKAMMATEEEKSWFGAEVLLEADGHFPKHALCSVNCQGKYVSDKGVALVKSGNLGSRTAGLKLYSDLAKAVHLLKAQGFNVIM